MDPRFRRARGLPNPDYNLDGKLEQLRFAKKLHKSWDVIDLDGEGKFGCVLRKMWGSIDLGSEPETRPEEEANATKSEEEAAAQGEPWHM